VITNPVTPAVGEVNKAISGTRVSRFRFIARRYGADPFEVAK
jgi:hypothetical protein